MCSRKWLIVALVACALASACQDFNTNLSVQTASSTLTFVSPSTATVGGKGFTISATGTGFTTGALILWNGNPLTTTLVSGILLTAPVPASDLATAGTVQVAVEIPGSAQSPTQNIYATTTSAVSNVVLFTIGGTPVAPPTITSLSASTTSAASTPYCSTQGFTLTVSGTNFTSDAVVNWNGVPLSTSTSSFVSATTFVSATQLTASVPAADVALSGTPAVTVSNSLGTSNSMPLRLSAPAGGFPVPTISSVSPNAIGAGSLPSTITLQGSVLPCTVIQWVNSNNLISTLPTIYSTAIAATQTSPAVPASLAATVPAADLLNPGFANIQVVNPGTNASSQFQISLPAITSISASTTSSNSTPYCNSTGLTLTVTGIGFANGLVVNWNGSPRPTAFMSPTQLNATISPADTAFLATGAAAVAITVSGSGSGTNSNSLKFSVTALPTGTNLPAPVISSISPTTAAMETLTGPPVPLTVNGSGLSPCSVVQWNGAPLPASIFIGTSGLTSVIPAANITAAGMNQVAVATPAPGGGTSGNETFTVYTPGSPTTTGIAGSALSLPLMSSDQRYVVFVMASTDGINEILGSTENIFVSDTCTGAPAGCTPSRTLVSAGIGGAAANGDSISPSISGNISADGRYVSFLSSATNLVATDTNGATDAFVRDTCAGASPGCTPSTQLVSVTTLGAQANGATTSATIDATGRYITFESEATNLGAVSSSGGIFLRDTCAGGPAGCVPSTQPLD